MGPEEEDAEQQIAVINQAISQKVDVIVLAACDPESENEALASATAAGIPIITIDSDVTYEGKNQLCRHNEQKRRRNRCKTCG